MYEKISDYPDSVQQKVYNTMYSNIDAHTTFEDISGISREGKTEEEYIKLAVEFEDDQRLMELGMADMFLDKELQETLDLQLALLKNENQQEILASIEASSDLEEKVKIATQALQKQFVKK